MKLKPEELASIFHTHFTFTEVTEDIRESVPAKLDSSEALTRFIAHAQPDEDDIFNIVNADLTATPTQDINYIQTFFIIEFKDDARRKRYYQATGNTSPYDEYVYYNDMLLTFIYDHMMDVIEKSN